MSAAGVATPERPGLEPDARPRRVCVTGGLGFIGTHLCEALAERGYEVRCVDRLSGRYALGSGQDRWAALEALPGVELVHADAAQCPTAAILDDAEAVIHLAALPGVRARHGLAELWSQNAVATARLVGEATRRGQRIVLASTSSVYGDSARLPTPERTPAAPLSLYALSKLAAEQASLKAAARYGADVVVARLFSVYGPRQRPDMAFARWIEAIVAGRPIVWCADPLAARDFTYVDDAVAGLVAALERGSAGEIYNVAGTGPRALRDALRLLERLLGRTAAVRRRRPSSAEAVMTAACGEKAARQLGYRALVSLEDGLERQLTDALATATAPLARPQAQLA